MYYFTVNLAIALAYLTIPLLLLPLLKNAQWTIKINLFLAIAFVFSCGIGHSFEAFHLHLNSWHLVTAIVSWIAVFVLYKSKNNLYYLYETIQLMDTTWNKSLTAKMLFQKQDNDLLLVKNNPMGASIFQNLLKEGDLLCEKIPSFRQILDFQDVSLIEIYLNSLKYNESLQFEFLGIEPIVGHYINMCVPLSENFLFITFLDTTELKCDALTGLFNRRFLDSSNKKWQGCIYLDLDRFKLINDLRGHELGDKILKKVASVLQQSVHKYKGVAIRQGGDEFLLMFTFSDVYEIAVSVLEGILEIDVEGATVGASLGIATVGDIQGFEDNELIDRLQYAAETATREAKLDQRSNLPQNRIKIWDAKMAEKKARQVTIEACLAQRSSEKEFWIAYQPICNLLTGKIVAAEALIRWNSAQLGVVSPSEFIPIAENTRLIYRITDWVLKSALKQLNSWHQISPNFCLSINLSPRELDDENFSEYIHQIIRNAEVPSHTVGLEITERGIYQNLQRYYQSLQKLKAMSISLKIDDFGTGQSGLSQLIDFRFDEIKVDKCFIPQSLDDKEKISICEAIKTLSEGLNFNLTAEGIENISQKEILANLGYTYGQGYYFARPMPAEELTKILQENPQLPL